MGKLADAARGITPRAETLPWRVERGDCLEILRTLSDASVDAVVTDPPAGIGFMGKGWDSDKGGRDAWIAWLASIMREVSRVLKPGGHALIWALPRTSHWTATAVEDAGFEIRDVVTHLFGTGFPKSLDVSKAIDKDAGHWRGKSPGPIEDSQRAMAGPHYEKVEKGPPVTAAAAAAWQGWGTALKPAAENWILARKPLIGTVAANVLEHGTGALNVAGCRVGDQKLPAAAAAAAAAAGKTSIWGTEGNREALTPERVGRWPANLILDEEAAAILDHQSGTTKSGHPRDDRGGGIWHPSSNGVPAGPQYGDSGGASRFFYCAKPSTRERDEGLEAFAAVSGGEATDREEGSAGLESPRAGAGRNGGRRNTHPTVKSIALMRYLCRLITPPEGLVLDPFCGSGSTGCAAVLEGFRFVGIEREEEYARIASARIERWSKERP